MKSVKRTVYVCDIERNVTEEQLAGLFTNCGLVVDCRICGDPNSTLRFAFVEFTSEGAATAALTLNGAVLNFTPIQVLPSKTAIMPVNPVYLPRSQEELEICSRTVYVTNIDQAIERYDLNTFFEHTCGKVSKSRLLGQHHLPTRIAFVEFVRAESAMGALNLSGALLGKHAIRVSPSKTPVRLKSTAPSRHNPATSQKGDQSMVVNDHVSDAQGQSSVQSGDEADGDEETAGSCQNISTS